MKSILALLIVFNSVKCGAQNLVPNPSFEDTLANPNWPSSGLIQNACLNWFSPLPGSADYLNDLCYLCPGCISLIRTPHSGSAYAGIYTFNRDTFFREAIQVQLVDTLVPDKTYCVSFYTSRYYVHNYSCGDLGVYFSTTSLTNTTNSITTLQPQVQNDPQINHLIDTSWTLISGEFVALGGERFLTITNFTPDQQSDTLHVGSEQFTTMQQAYYFIDDVSVVCLPILNAGADSSIVAGDTLIISGAISEYWTGMQFEWLPHTGLYDPYSLVTAAYPESTITYVLTVSCSTCDVPCLSEILDSVTVSVADIEPPHSSPFHVATLFTTDQCFVIDSLPSKTRLSIYDARGRLMYFSDNYNNDFSLARFSPAIYTYEITLADTRQFKGKFGVFQR